MPGKQSRTHIHGMKCTGRANTTVVHSAISCSSGVSSHRPSTLVHHLESQELAVPSDELSQAVHPALAGFQLLPFPLPAQ